MFAQVLKNSGDAQRKAWLKRTRAIRHGGKGVGWTNEDGSPLDAGMAERLKAIKVFPGWTNVRISTDPDADVLAEGTDKKGRPVKVYSKNHSDKQAAAKFARVEELHKHMPKLMKQSGKDMMDMNLDERTRDNAATINLVSKTGFRPGSTRDTKADEQAYGASTLEKRHIKVNGDKIAFAFTGKKGVSITKDLKDAELAGYLTGKLKKLKDTDKVFETSGASAMNYMRKIVGPQFKVKDLRTWNGTALAKHLIRKSPAPTDAKGLAEMKKTISTKVSDHLGNTPKIALDSYINPAVWPNVGATTPVKGK